MSAGSVLRNTNIEKYEQYVLVALNKNYKLWETISGVLCYDANKHKYINEFNDTFHYIIFRAMLLWRNETKADKDSFAPISSLNLSVSILLLSKKEPALVDTDRIEDIKKLWDEINSSITEKEASSIVRDDWTLWLSSLRSLAAVINIKRTDGLAAEQVLTDLIRQRQALTEAADDDGFDTVEEVADKSPEAPIERFSLSPTTWSTLNHALGGGFGRGEHTIIISPSGGGKTVMACQIAAELAYSDRNVLFVSTEEPLSKLLPRFVTMMSFLRPNPEERIPYDQIRYKSNFKDYLPEDKYKVAKEICSQLNKHFLFKDWTGSKSENKVGANFKQYRIEDLDIDVKKAIEYFSAKGQSLDMVIFDWLGATLSQNVSDSSQLRLIYNNAASFMRDLAVKYNIATISLAQTSADAAKKTYIDNTCIAESKNLHLLAHAALGISHIANNNVRDGEVGSSFKERQCFNLFKSRGGQAQTFWMKENFGYQRYDK